MEHIDERWSDTIICLVRSAEEVTQSLKLSLLSTFLRGSGEWDYKWVARILRNRRLEMDSVPLAVNRLDNNEDFSGKVLGVPIHQVLRDRLSNGFRDGLK